MKMKDKVRVNVNRWFLILICVIVASLPLFMNYLINGHDLEFHLIRIEGIYNGIKNEIFPVKIQDYWFNGYGYPVGVFYGDWLLYIPVLFRFLGFSIQASYQLFVFIINFLTAVVAYCSFKRLFNDEKIGVLGCYIYTLSLYRLENVYSRAAVGEYCAMIFLPIVFLGMYEILFEKDQGKSSPVVILSIGLTGLIHTHMLSCEMVAIFILITCVIFIKNVLKRNTFVKLLLTVLITVLLSLDFLVPFLDYYIQDYVLVTSELWVWRRIPIQDLGLFLNQIFAVFIKPFGQSVGIEAGVYKEITFSIGLPLILGMILFGYVALNINKEQKRDLVFKIGVYSFVMFVFTLLLSSRYFPWTKISTIHEICLSLISSIQFPWRFLSIASLFGVIFSCVSIIYLEKKLKEAYRYLPLYTIFFALIISVGAYNNSILFEANEEGDYYCYNADDLNIKRFDAGEYLPESTVGSQLEEGKIFKTNNIILREYSKEGLSIECNVFADELGGYIEVPLLYYKGYKVIDTNTNLNLDFVNGNNNVIRIILPANYSGNIKIFFEEPIYWRIAEIVTYCSIIILVVYLLFYVTKFWRTK